MGNYIVKCYIDSKCCLCAVYKRKRWAIKCYDKRVESGCYDRVALVLKNIVYFYDSALVLKEWYNTNRKGVIK